MEVDRRRRLLNQRRLRQLVRGHGSEVKVFCAHDVVELSTMKKLSGAMSEPISVRVDRMPSSMNGRLAGAG